MAIDQKLINEINALAHKKKTVGLTPEEQVRQQKLRQKYLKEFRRGFEQHVIPDFVRFIAGELHQSNANQFGTGLRISIRSFIKKCFNRFFQCV